VFVPIWGSIGPVVWPSMLDMWCCARICAHCARINATQHNTTQHNTTQHRTGAILEKYNTLEPVSVGVWTKIRLRRIPRSCTCVCLRILNYLFCSALRAICMVCMVLHARLGAQRAHQCAIATADPNNWAQFGPRSAQLFGRLCWMCNNTRTFTRAARTSMRIRERRPP
jgi:hypothetical protein